MTWVSTFMSNPTGDALAAFNALHSSPADAVGAFKTRLLARLGEATEQWTAVPRTSVGK